MTTATVESGPADMRAAGGAASGANVFASAVASEWVKLRSVRSTMWSLLLTFVFTAGLGVLFSFAFLARFNQLGPEEKLSFDPTLHSLRGLFLAQLAIGVLGVLVISSEYASGQIRTSLAAVPQRGTFFAAKASVFGAVALVVAMVSVFVAFFAAQAVLSQKDFGVSIGDPHVLRAVLGAGFYLFAMGMLGLAFGTIFRRTAGGIAVLVACVFVLPLLAQALPTPWNRDVSHLLPGAFGGAGESLMTVRFAPELLAPSTALVVLAVWLVVAIGAAAVLIARRDA